MKKTLELKQRARIRKAKRELIKGNITRALSSRSAG